MKRQHLKLRETIIYGTLRINRPEMQDITVDTADAMCYFCLWKNLYFIRNINNRCIQNYGNL